MDRQRLEHWLSEADSLLEELGFQSVDVDKKVMTEEAPVPDDSLAGLSDVEQVALIERTDNGLDAADAKHPQPSQEPLPEES